MRTCKKCGESKREEDFGYTVSSAGGKRYLRGSCRECLRSKHRGYSRKHRYGVSVDQFESMVERQGGRCAICNTPDPGPSGTWTVDHDHSCCPGRQSCGKCVRSLLCQNCNQGIGFLQDSPGLLMAAAAYLLQRTNLLTEGEWNGLHS